MLRCRCRRRRERGKHTEGTLGTLRGSTYDAHAILLRGQRNELEAEVKPSIYNFQPANQVYQLYFGEMRGEWERGVE